MLRLYLSVENLTAKTVAAEIGVGESTIARFVAGKALPDAEGLVKIAAWCFAREAAPQRSLEELTQ